uniref:Carboxy-terminal domain RNA polymerase II polypeptide A small phosphatase n=1 Tax=Tetraselmis sp. GSL018 TaxID=582737 RepID=A0A061SIS4_9CHLO|eukprot:CAMPEP_0177580560 /NCGR_PEP_ID=MMETSP0419_2-20121207/1629_1 /TAXON_ID=582737 /ORGANISM="Tetraselmis sp., Strain GSL018" /LENGTH=334 /DNA_ID=CAMNT_0019069443 /DNA_START=576 /DNA_END=1580 /DNA_ORIENTATION=-
MKQEVACGSSEQFIGSRGAVAVEDHLLPRGGYCHDVRPTVVEACGTGSYTSCLHNVTDGRPEDKVIIQVTPEDAAMQKQYFERSGAVQEETSASPGVCPGWKQRFRSLLCCLAPTNRDMYFRAEADAKEKVSFVPQRPLHAPSFKGEFVIPPLSDQDRGRKTLVLDLDETLVHSSFKPVDKPDHVLPVEIEGNMVNVYVLERPWLKRFLRAVSARFEVIVFTASLDKYAAPLLDLIDKDKCIRHRLFRDACCFFEGNYVKDLECLGRRLESTVIVDNSAHSYAFHPENAIPVSSFIDDPTDHELLDILPILYQIEQVDDVRQHLPLNSRPLMEI